jgi:DNA-directed RNA polymerase subunit RPC12/RpoP
VNKLNKIFIFAEIFKIDMNKIFSLGIILVLLGVGLNYVFAQQKAAHYYCKWCGSKYSSISSLTAGSCSRNSNGKKHELYEGSEKKQYYCKWCGSKYSSISSLTAGSCSRNPNGKKHEPYEGDEKSQYVCKYCGSKYSSISSLTAGSCSKSPTKKHHPAQ